MVELLYTRYSIYLSSIPLSLLLLTSQVLTSHDRLHVPDPLCSQNNKATYNPIPSRTLCPIRTQNRRTPSSEAGCYRRTLSILSTLWLWRQSSATRTFSIQTSTYGKGQRLGTSLLCINPIYTMYIWDFVWRVRWFSTMKNQKYILYMCANTLYICVRKNLRDILIWTDIVMTLILGYIVKVLR